MFSRKIVFAILLCSLVLPAQIALAGGDVKSKIPEFNPLCWKWTEDGAKTGTGGCREARKNLMSDATETQLKEGWIQDQKTCGSEEKWGLCLPPGKTKTSISFAGKTEFLHIGDYILTVYKYALTIASIVAVVMIIMAGLQWLTSGGNSDMITKAKTRITGAFVGLFILYASYFILNTINPALVNLRLPQTYMIKPQILTPTFCSSAPSTTKFALGADYTDQTKKLDAPSGKYGLEPYKKYFGPEAKTEDKKQFRCGKRFFLEGGGGSTCFGNYCPMNGMKQSICTDLGTDPKQKYICKDGGIMGVITYNPVGKLVNDWGTPLTSGQGLVVACKDSNESREISTKSEPTNEGNKQTFVLVLSPEDVNKAVKECGGEDKAGFAVKLSMNQNFDFDDQYNFFGKSSKHLGVALHPLEAANYKPDEYLKFSFYNGGTLLGKGKINSAKVNFVDLFSLKDIVSGVQMSVDATKVLKY